MNVQRGLERISAVWWGLFGACGIVLFVAAVFNPDRADRISVTASGAILAACAYAAHRITCWIVAGFFAPRA
jgi:hypothetical protein